MAVANWQREQKQQKNAPEKRSAVGATLRYMYKPRIGQNFNEIGRTMGIFPRLLAHIFVAQKLFPIQHPALRDDSMRLTMREVIGTAYSNLDWNKEGTPKIVFFFAVLSSLVFSLVATLYFLTGFLINPAHAGIFDNVLGAADISNRWLDYMFQTTAGATFQNQVPNNATGGVVTQTIGNNVPLAFRTLAAMYSTAMLILAALILIYHLISMVVATAHDGRVMGKAAHQVWAPVRLIFALGLLIPVANGFSSGQWLILQIAKLGSNLASNVWRDPNVGARVTGTPTVFTSMPDLEADQTIDTLANIGYCSKQIQLKTAATPNTAAFFGGFNTPGARTVANAANVANVRNSVLFNPALQPQQAIAVNARRNAVVSGAGVSTVAGVNSKIYYPVSPVLPGATYTMPYDINPCGSVVFPSLADDGSVAAADPAFRNILQGIATAHARAFNAIEERALQIGATHFVAKEYGGNCLATPGMTASCANSSGVDITASKNLLKTGPGGYRATFIANLPAGVAVNAEGKLVYTNTPTAAQATTLAGGCGWMCASGWFASLASKHNAFGKSAGMTPSLKANCETADCGEETIKAQQEQEEKALGAALKDWISNLGVNPMDWFKGAAFSVMRSIGLADPNTDRMIWHTQFTSPSPVSDMIAMGNVLVDGAVTLLIVGVVLNLGGAVNAMIEGGKSDASGNAGVLKNNTGGTLTGTLVSKLLKFLPTGKVAQIIGKFMKFGSMLAPLFFGLASMMFVPGVMLFYLLPFLPFINFMTGVITWLISLLQAVVAIPVIAIAHITPHGEGLPSGAARGAYLMILQIFLRPVMMIIGMLVCVLIMNTGIAFLNVVFFNIYKNNLLGSADGLLSNIIFMGLYAATAWGIVNAAVTAIDDFPLNAVKWIGGGSVDHNHDFGRFGQAMVGAMAGQGFGQVSRAAQGISNAPTQLIGNAGSANTNANNLAQAGADRAATDAYRQQRLAQGHNDQMQRAGHMGDTSPQGQIAQAQGNASILPGDRGGNGGMTTPVTPPNNNGGGGAGGALPPGYTTSPGGIAVPNGAGGGARTQGQQAYMEAAREGRPMSDLPVSGQGGAASPGTPPFTRGGVSPAAANNIRSAGNNNVPAAQQRGQIEVPQSVGGGARSQAQQGAMEALRTGRPVTLMTDRDAIINRVIDKYEGGSRLVTDSGGLTKYGISQNAYPGLDIRNLTREQAVEIYKRDYWNRIGADRLPPEMRLMAFDTAVNQGVGRANQFLARSGGDVETFTQLRANHYQNLAESNPEKYGQYLKGWMNRLGDVFSMSTGGGTMTAAAPGGIDPGGGSGGGRLSDGVHTVLGLASFVPGLNIVTSGIDAIIYTAEGRYGEAAIAGVGMIPGGKWVTTGGKLLRLGKGGLSGAGRLARLDRGMDALSGGSGGGGGRAAPAGSDNDYDPYSTLLYAAALRRYLSGNRNGNNNAPARA